MELMEEVKFDVLLTLSKLDVNRAWWHFPIFCMRLKLEYPIMILFKCYLQQYLLLTLCRSQYITKTFNSIIVIKYRFWCAQPMMATTHRMFILGWCSSTSLFRGFL